MENEKRVSRIISVLINAVVVLWMGYCTYNIFKNGLIGNMTGGGIRSFRYYTIDSNMFAAISALVMLIFGLSGRKAPKSALVFKYFGTCTVTITFLTVVAFLGPTIGYAPMFAGDNLYMHLVGPLLCIAGFCFFDGGQKLTMADAAKSLIPTALYAVVYYLMVMRLKRWPDFYGFNAGGKWYISVVLMMLAAFLVACALRALHNKHYEKYSDIK